LRKNLVKIVLAILISNVLFVSFVVFEGGKYPINLMTEQEVFGLANSIPYSREATAESIAENRASITDFKQYDTPKTKYSKYLTVRSWDVRTDIMLNMVFVALTICIPCLIYLGVKGITIVNNKYIVLGDKEADQK